MKSKIIFLLIAFPVVIIPGFAQGTLSRLQCNIRGGVEVHASRESSSPVIARINCGDPVLLIDNRFASPHVRTEDGKDGFITDLNIGQLSTGDAFTFHNFRWSSGLLFTF